MERMKAFLAAKSIVIYQRPDRYIAWVRTHKEERIFELRYSPKQYSPDCVRRLLQADNPQALVRLHI